jgi:hypothetical protein
LKKLLLAGLFSLLPLLVAAQSPFDGTWKFDMSSAQFPKKPDVYVLENGMYECKSCVPSYKIKADGTDQAVSGHPYYDMLSVKVVDDHNVELTSKRGGKVVFTEKDMISSDGNTLTSKWSDMGQPAGGEQSGTSTSTRVGKAPASGNMLTGSWRTDKQDMSAGVLTWTYKVSGDELSMTNPTGQSYTAKLGGPEAPYKGDPGTTGVKVKMRGKDTLEEIDMRGDKVIGIGKMTLAADGKTAKLVYEDKLHGTTMSGTAVKQ